MNKNWLIKKDNLKLILFFNGWGMDSSAVSHLKTDNYDIVEFNDYQTIDFDEDEYTGYEEIYLVAWSLGVWAACFALDSVNLPLVKSIAVNGTLNPVHPDEGISPAIFEGTYRGWDERNRKRFLLRTIGDRAELEANASKFGNRSLENQKEELVSVYRQIKACGPFDFKTDTALIGTKDIIFTPQNQIRYWEGKADYKLLEMPHYPFLQFSSWTGILTQ